MKRLKRIFSSVMQSFIVLVGITLITFFILHISPGNPAEIWLTGGDGNVGQISEEAIKIQEEKMGLDKPFLVQYGLWLGNVMQGNLGNSLTTGQPVVNELAACLLPTVALATFSLLITVIISIPSGIYCAVYKDGHFDNIVRSFSFFGISLPSFLSALALLWFFCLKLKWFPVIATMDFKGMLLPTVVFVIQCSSKLTRQVRAVILDELNQEYVKGALARGVKERTILFSHVLKNAANPILTWVSIYLGVLLGGAAIIETIFSWQGLGKLAVEAVARLDYFMIQGFVLWVAIIFLVVNLMLDIISSIIDPRIKKG
ncbi:ABC transporter permease [Acetobacterium woodii]|uniref:Oligopeptide ABC transport system permease OppB2 n=1 Tax=Acetobacterium woodii (strain ATCC 29683 / DSM 1030 / JCM 2381 / KCTC 1655 / WB1) TaxID=931626 RepID=H6LEC6_ACEWD|nr:ABC transporter permease [Acetobacterium woodii]AFA46840.1 oligopeptide ABC transport system permease OppB2 [Acetobacterium woodii DSM 1030]